VLAGKSVIPKFRRTRLSRVGELKTSAQ
jgi:hypothetical protein